MKAKFNPWPYSIIGFFALLICALATIVVVAATHRDSMVSENYYEQEIQFQHQIDSAARAEQCGAAIRLDAAAGKLLVALPASQLAQKFSGTVVFYRPSAPEFDRTLPLTPASDGTQILDVSRFAAGRWQVRVRWNAGGQDYFLEKKMTISKTNPRVLTLHKNSFTSWLESQN